MRILDVLGIETSTFILILIMFVCAWLLLRDVKAWYWKINQLIKNQEEQLDIMDEILFELKANNEHYNNELTEETGPIEEVTPNEEDTH